MFFFAASSQFAHEGRHMKRAGALRDRPVPPVVSLIACLVLFNGSAIASADEAELPEAIRTTGETVVLAVHAEGAQVYECSADAAGKLAWVFREPIATLIRDGKTVGRHYAGPRWELADGSAVLGKVEGKATGSTAADIPWLRLSVARHEGKGALDDATTIQRIHTQGGALSGDCEAAGAFRSVAYAADYLFSRR